MVPATDNHKALRTTMPSLMRFRPKNTGVQRPFSAICKDHIAIATALSGDNAARAPAADMHRYSVVHVTGKTQSGGVQLGLVRLRYHGPGANNPPVDPAAKHARRKMPNK